jgi:uncharacterized membrane protein YbhN (UPF0104 family)
MAGPEVTSSRMRLLRGVLTVVALVAIAVALTRAIDDAGEVALPGPGRLVLSGALLAIGMVAATSAWATLLPRVGFRSVLPGFALAQLAKYVPGSVWQGVGQVADAHRLGIAVPSATVSYVVQMVLQALVAAAMSIAALTAPGLPWWLAVPAALGPLGLLLIRRRWLDAVIGAVARRIRRLDAERLELPSQAALLQAAARSLVTILTVGASFAVLLPSEQGLRGFVGTAGIFVLAWVIGFLVVPLPSGLGVRELVLVVGLADLHPVADILAASVVARLVLVVVEAGFVAVAQFARIDRPPR